MELRDRTLRLVARLSTFQARADQARNELLDKTLPGWSEEARVSGFRQATQSLRQQHEQTQVDFEADFRTEADSLRRELMARLGIPVRHDGEALPPLHYDAAAYLEELALKLAP